VTFSDYEPEDTECGGEEIKFTFLCIASCRCGQHTRLIEAKRHVDEPIRERPKPSKRGKSIQTNCRVCQNKSFSTYGLCRDCRSVHCRKCLDPKSPRVSLCVNCMPSKLRITGPLADCRRCSKPCHSISKLCRDCKLVTCSNCPESREFPSRFCADCKKSHNSTSSIFIMDKYGFSKCSLVSY